MTGPAERRFLCRDGAGPTPPTFPDARLERERSGAGHRAITGTVAPGGTYNDVLHTTLPSVAPGSYYIIIRTNVFDQVYETSPLDSFTASTGQISVSVPSLQVGVPLSTTLSTGQQQLYSINVAAGRTLRVDLTSSDPTASNEIYLRYGAVPTNSTYDAIYQGPLEANQYAVIPSTQAGTYYLLVEGQSEPAPNTAVTLLAHLLPFEDHWRFAGRGGRRRLRDDNDRRFAVEPRRGRQAGAARLRGVYAGSYKVVNATQIIAEFDLTGATLGQYDVEVIDPDSAIAWAPYRYLVERALPEQVSIGLGGPSVLFAGTSATYGFTVTNTSNVSDPYVQFRTAFRISTDRPCNIRTLR